MHIARVSITDELAVAEAIAAGVAKFGPISCVVNNAGVANPYMRAPLAACLSGGEGDAAASARVAETVREFRQVVDVNLTGALVVTACALPYLVTTTAREEEDPPLASIIHVSSTRARMSEPNSEAYAASKAGLLGLMHAQVSSRAPVLLLG